MQRLSTAEEGYDKRDDSTYVLNAIQLLFDRLSQRRIVNQAENK
jgi:hypothetical protein